MPRQDIRFCTTADKSTQYSAMNTGICTRIGRHPPSGVIFSVLYISIILICSCCLSLAYCSCSAFILGAMIFILAIERAAAALSG